MRVTVLTRSWPFPGDRAVDRARQVAQQYRAALAQVDPAACAEIDRGAAAAGETWALLRPPRFDDHELVSVPEAAEEIGRSVRAVYNWVADGTLPRYAEGGKIRVLMGAARRIDAQRRARAD